MEHELWPARGVAEHAYCPRLFHYMTVEGVFLPSSDTEQGAGIHRRVDRPSQAPPTPPDDASKQGTACRQTMKLEDGESDPARPRSVRSLALTSERLGLTATLDLAEIEGMTAVPVEYRKGKPKRPGQVVEPADEMMEQPRLLPGPEPWPTDRVQVGLQILLLEEAGYPRATRNAPNFSPISLRPHPTRPPCFRLTSTCGARPGRFPSPIPT